MSLPSWGSHPGFPHSLVPILHLGLVRLIPGIEPQLLLYLFLTECNVLFIFVEDGMCNRIIIQMGSINVVLGCKLKTIKYFYFCVYPHQYCIL